MEGEAAVLDVEINCAPLGVDAGRSKDANIQNKVPMKCEVGHNGELTQ